MKKVREGENGLFLQELIKDWPCRIIGQQFRVHVSGITENSKVVKPGFIFVVKRGKREDGQSYLKEALENGAVAIVIDRNLSIACDERIPVIRVPNCATFLSHASAVLAGFPSERLTIIAITGTNGKTTVSHFISQLLQGMGCKTAVIGTVGVFVEGVCIQTNTSALTTLPAEELHPLLQKLVAQQVTHVILEASSIGLESSRLAHCEIDIGVLLNITEDHFEEHGSEAAYVQAKSILVQQAGKMIVNRDDIVCMELAKGIGQPALTFGFSKEADVQYKTQRGAAFIQHKHHCYEVQLKNNESFNQMNALAAISVLLELNIPLSSIILHLQRLSLPEGRMEKLVHDKIDVIIDYAHTPAALFAVLQSIKSKRILVVFGCGGERDKQKRKEMGEIAAYFADKIIVTSDNPRAENPLLIIEDIVSGMEHNSTPYTIEVDREKAIELAIEEARRGDCVIIAGKGHEKSQIIAGKQYSFSDREVAERMLQKKKK